MDKVEKLVKQRELLVDKIEEDYLKELDKVLDNIEKEIMSVVKDAPLKGDNLTETTFAIASRAKFKSIVDKHFNSWADKTVRRYDSLAKKIDDNAKALPGYKPITREEINKITALKRLQFAKFVELSTETSNALATQFYQATISGRPFNDAVKDLQLRIQGIYMKADKAEVDDLVAYVKSLDKDSPERKKALNKLHSLYGADAAGNSMRKYAKVLAHEALKQFDGQTTKMRAESAGLTDFLYFGDLIGDSRDFCKLHVGKRYNERDLKRIWSGTWQGKSGSDPHLDVGGYNCRHHLQPISPDWYNEDGDLII